jgi:peptidoglycan/xylan/chitin deacetylase (PgdA/CDA1 family)
MFRRLNVNATFFVLGEIAEKSPELLRSIVKEGHEIACHGYTHNSIEHIEVQEFEYLARKAKEAIKRVLGYEPLGYRSPNAEINTEAVNILENLGFRYDSSVVPCVRIPGWYGYPSAPIAPYKPSRQDICKPDKNRDFWEIPIAVFPFFRLPGGGGWFLRNFGGLWTKTLVKILLKENPVTIYIHSWEVSDFFPKLKGVPFHVYRRTGRYVRNAIESIVKETGAELMSIERYLRTTGYSYPKE